jgi:predicted transcriptional regulator
MLTSEQIRGARAMLRIEQKELAQMAGVSLETIKRVERSPGVVSAYASTVDSLQRALEAAGVEFTNGDQPGVRLRKTETSKSIPIDKLNASNDE